MLSEKTKMLLTSAAKKACEDFGLYKVYFAQHLGRRRHYLAGYGKEMFMHPDKAVLTEKISVFWEGKLLGERKKALVEALRPIAEQVEKELE